MSSILNDVKHQLGLLPELTDYDTTIISFTNTALSILTQLGVGPSTGIQITGPDEQWDIIYDDVRLNTVQSYVYLRVRMLFDPPKVGGLISSMERQITELEYRMNVEVDF